ncbi:carbohydrate porin [Tolumonas lignilytica]|uniref:carbohydrate porin n=1 Tax=Tolumonas lignilytica TaxID=1283284 RepID=UPI000464E193|nr:carbohydrate porin [Tolumonas lignilytica]
MKKLNVLVPSVLALFVASAAHAGATFDTPQGKLTLAGDVEYNFDMSHINSSVTQHASNGNGTDHIGNSGRIDVTISGERVLSNGNFGGFTVVPQVTSSGAAASDDAFVTFGVKNDWAYKFGHFEAYDLTPAGQDTWAGGYEMYKASEARGRNNSAMMINKLVGPMYYELGASYGDYSSGDSTNSNTLPVAGSNYLTSGLAAYKAHDPIVLRPVMAYTGDMVSAALGGEFNVITDAFKVDGVNGPVDLSKRNGVGGNVTFKVSPDLSIVTRAAYLSAVANDQFSVGAGAQYQNFWLGYLFGNEKVKANTDLAIGDAKADAHEVYASYKIPSVMGLDNFDMYLGAYWTQQLAKDAASAALAKPTDYGSRVRFKYFF